MSEWIESIHWDSALATAVVTAIFTIIANRIDRKHAEGVARKEAKARESRALLHIVESCEKFVLLCHARLNKINLAAHEGDLRNLPKAPFEFPVDIDWDALGAIDISEIRDLATRYNVRIQWIGEMWGPENFDLWDAYHLDSQCIAFYGSLAGKKCEEIRGRIVIGKSPISDRIVELESAISTMLENANTRESRLIPELKAFLLCDGIASKYNWIKSVQ